MPLAAAAAITGITGLIGAKVSSNATKAAATAQTNAVSQSAELQSKSNADTLAFQKQQAQNEWKNQELTRQANYNQAKARLSTIAGVGNEYGLSGISMPDYVASQDPQFGGPGTIAGATAGPGTGATPGVPSDLKTAMQQANQIAYGGQAKHTDPSYWTALWAKDPEYAYRRMLGEGAGGADVATTGPYAGQGTAGAATSSKSNPYAATLAQAALQGPSMLAAPPPSAPVPGYAPRRPQPGTIAGVMRY